MAIHSEQRQLSLDDPERKAAQAAADSIQARLSGAPGPGDTIVLRAEGEQATEVRLPRAVAELLVEVLGDLAHGDAVTVVPRTAEVTTQEAAEILNVSRPYVVRLLEEGRIPFRKVGPRRRIRLADLMAFKHRDEARRREVAAELTAEAERLGLGY